MSVRSKPNREGEAPAEPERDGSELPEGWANVPLRELTAPMRPRRDPQQCPTLPYVGMEQVESNTRQLLGTSPSTEMKSTAFHFQPSDVLYGRLRPYLNKVWLADREGLCSSEFIVLPPTEAFESNYLSCFLSSDEFVAFANHLNQGDRPRVSFEQIGDYRIPLAPLAEQRRIVGKLELLLGKVSSSQQRLSRVPGLLKRFRQSVLAAACSGKLTADWREINTNANELFATSTNGITNERYDLSSEVLLDEIPSTWQHVAIGNVSEFQQGMQIAKATRSKEPGPNRLPILRIGNYANGFTDDVDYIELDAESLIAEAEDVILTRTGETRGKVLTGYRGVFHNNTFRLNFNAKLLHRAYLIYWLQTEFVQGFIAQHSGRSAQPDLTHRAFGPCPIPLPPLSEQQEIVRRVEKLFAFVDQIEARLRQAQEHVDRLTQSLLAKAFRGELVPTEHALATAAGRDYEPASALLERIRSEPEGATSTASPRRRKKSVIS